MALVIAVDRGQTIGDAREYEERILTAFNDSDFERAADCVEDYDSRYAGEGSKGLPEELRSENVCAEWESRIGLTLVNKIVSLDEDLRNSDPASWNSQKLTELDENIAVLRTTYPTGFDYIAENGSKKHFDIEKMVSDSYLYSVKYRNSLLKMDEGDTTVAMQAMEEVANSKISNKSIINKAQNALNNMIRSNPAADFKINDNDRSANTAAVPQNESVSHNEYTHIALEGCVITESDSLTGYCVYKTKCPVCGKTSAGGTSRYLISTLNTGATCSNADCPNWGKRFSVKIETNIEYIND